MGASKAVLDSSWSRRFTWPFPTGCGEIPLNQEYIPQCHKMTSWIITINYSRNMIKYDTSITIREQWMRHKIIKLSTWSKTSTSNNSETSTPQYWASRPSTSSRNLCIGMVRLSLKTCRWTISKWTSLSDTCSPLAINLNGLVIASSTRTTARHHTHIPNYYRRRTTWCSYQVYTPMHAMTGLKST